MLLSVYDFFETDAGEESCPEALDICEGIFGRIMFFAGHINVSIYSNDESREGI